jgi:hypothetical protein
MVPKAFDSMNIEIFCLQPDGTPSADQSAPLSPMRDFAIFSALFSTREFALIR